ncbi:hypothetical protein BJX68DRAFT_100505 [Aspergillus pseudodeflectus]|uniref:Uncharacterized protein n=1 Tax=Aspergillus pseudodeflectus TaxID=176178 RepID=A0ABR4K8L7_9EURO
MVELHLEGSCHTGTKRLCKARSQKREMRKGSKIQIEIQLRSPHYCERLRLEEPAFFLCSVWPLFVQLHLAWNRALNPDHHVLSGGVESRSRHRFLMNLGVFYHHIHTVAAIPTRVRP